MINSYRISEPFPATSFCGFIGMDYDKRPLKNALFVIARRLEADEAIL